MSNIQTGAERMPHDLSHLGFLAGQIGRLITISTTPVIAGDSFEMDAVGALRLSPLRRGLAIDSTVRSEERFSRNAETDLVCRLLLEKKNTDNNNVRMVDVVIKSAIQLANVPNHDDAAASFLSRAMAKARNDFFE